MASNFSVITNQFFNQTRNGLNFSLNTTEFTTSLKSNSGDVVKLTQTIELGIIVNEDLTKTVSISTLPFDATNAEIKATGIDWFAEGLYPGCTVRVEKGSSSQSITVTNITGVGNGKLVMSDANMTALISSLGLTDGNSYTDLVFKVTSVPTYCLFKYKLNPPGLLTPDYTSPLDTNEQAYYAKAIPTSPSFETMAFVGGQDGSSMSTVEIAYLTTLDNYRHRFQINHEFKNPYYKAGELTNIQDVINPALLAGANTLKYDNYYAMGTAAYHNSEFVNNGLTGDTGYFNENFNGKINNYTIENLTITNASGTGKLEATESNAINFDIVTTGTWNAGCPMVLAHSKLPTSAEYQFQTDDYDDVWIFDNIFSTESALPVSSGIFTDFEFTIGAADRIQVDVTIDFSAAQQARISDISNYALWIGVANEDLSDPDLIDRVNLLVDVNTYSRNTDVSGLITYDALHMREEFKGFASTSYTTFNGGDGDLWTATFNLTTDTTKQTTITKAVFKIMADNGTEKFLVGKPITFPLGLPLVYSDGTYIYQIINVDSQNNINMPDGAVLREVNATMSVPVPAALPSTTQTAEFQCGFQIPWRDWIENPNVPTLFYDASEPQNNRNEKTSNYSGVSSYEIYGILELTVANNVEDAPTVYELYSDQSTIIDFDAAGWTGFTGDVRLYDEDGTEVFELEDGRDLIIKIECTHALGTLSPQTLAAFMWIEINGASVQPSYLSSTYDLTSAENRLQPSDELATGNTQYVEIESTLNKVTLICKTNSENLTAGFDYIIRGRLWAK